MTRQRKGWTLAVAACLMLWPALAHADGPECTGEGCDRGRLIDHFPYVWYLRMHLGQQQTPEQYGSACYHITPSYRIFQPYCWYVNPAQLYPQGSPPAEPATTQAAAANPPPAPATQPRQEKLPPPRPMPPGPTRSEPIP
ncbi:MAG TPA: hypothetical protein VFA18_25430 [Gemmataceae bacterium]|nr:hypothetical protein [Gemmataceae bacterium]